MRLNGWLRLWLLSSATLIVVAAFVMAYSTYGMDACYRLISVSIANGATGESRDLAESIQNRVGEKVYCGSNHYSDMLTLEHLAKTGVVTQIGFEWQEPGGWTFSQFDMLDVIDGKEITAQGVIGRATTYVHKSRLVVSAKIVGLCIAISLAILCFGLGITWVRRGFLTSSA
jgi:hypothetical protein